MNAIKTEAKRIYYKEYYKRNREAKLRRQNEYAAMNREREAMRARNWRKANPEKVRALNLSWTSRNKDHISSYKKDYLRNNRDIIQANRRLRKARIRGTPLHHKITAEEWSEIINRYDHRCAYCFTSGKMTMDHVIAISRGGSHTSDNVVPACMSCNARKQARSVDEFLKGP